MRTEAQGVCDGLIGPGGLTGAMRTSSSPSVTYANSPSKMRSAACMTSLYLRKAARACGTVAP